MNYLKESVRGSELEKNKEIRWRGCWTIEIRHFRGGAVIANSQHDPWSRLPAEVEEARVLEDPSVPVTPP